MAREADVAFRDFVLSRQRALLRSAWLLTGDWASAEDLVQASLLKVWPHWPRVVVNGQEDAYVRRVVLNTYLSSRRRAWHRERPTADVPDVESADALLGSDLRPALLTGLAALPPRQRAVVVLRYFQDLSEAQCAEALDCAVGTVKSQTSKALATLRRNPALVSLLEGADRA
ncbi:MAG: polymerase, sigma-24 subunit, subfamily protein [Frankiales bacterium]|jgi:RNA polymerase sigma-70 factor (sigma-E family)|nr:polymerase, sigma-24 subunit, subfamily protein [Frankiales bacterium]